MKKSLTSRIRRDSGVFFDRMSLLQFPDEEVIGLSAVIHDVLQIPVPVFLVQAEEG